MAVQPGKGELRKQAEAARASLTAAERAERSSRMCEAAVRLLERRRSDAAGKTFVLFGYIPFRTEPEVTPVLQWCWERNGIVLAPKVSRERNQMSLHAIRGFHDLEPGKWGIREPAPSVPPWTQLSVIDAMLVPGLAFDRQGGRLGYGGGYYDAFVRACRAAAGREPFKLALAFEAQLVPDVPMDAHDFRVDAIVTEKREWTISRFI